MLFIHKSLSHVARRVKFLPLTLPTPRSRLKKRFIKLCGKQKSLSTLMFWFGLWFLEYLIAHLLCNTSFRHTTPLSLFVHFVWWAVKTCDICLLIAHSPGPVGGVYYLISVYNGSLEALFVRIFFDYWLVLHYHLNFNFYGPMLSMLFY